MAREGSAWRLLFWPGHTAATFRVGATACGLYQGYGVLPWRRVRSWPGHSRTLRRLDHLGRCRGAGLDLCGETATDEDQDCVSEIAVHGFSDAVVYKRAVLNNLPRMGCRSDVLDGGRPSVTEPGANPSEQRFRRREVGSDTARLSPIRRRGSQLPSTALPTAASRCTAPSASARASAIVSSEREVRIQDLRTPAQDAAGVETDRLARTLRIPGATGHGMLGLDLLPSAFSPEEDRLLSGSSDRTACVWITDPDALVRAAKARSAGRQLTAAERQKYGRWLYYAK